VDKHARRYSPATLCLKSATSSFFSPTPYVLTLSCGNPSARPASLLTACTACFVVVIPTFHDVLVRSGRLRLTHNPDVESVCSHSCTVKQDHSLFSAPFLTGACLYLGHDTHSLYIRGPLPGCPGDQPPRTQASPPLISGIDNS